MFSLVYFCVCVFLETSLVCRQANLILNFAVYWDYRYVSSWQLAFFCVLYDDLFLFCVCYRINLNKFSPRKSPRFCNHSLLCSLSFSLSALVMHFIMFPHKNVSPVYLCYNFLTFSLLICMYVKIMKNRNEIIFSQFLSRVLMTDNGICSGICFWCIWD